MTSDDRVPSPADEQEGARSSRSREGRKQLPLWQETILLLGIAVVLAVVIKALLVQAFYIPSPSMEPGFVKDDRILVQKVSYWGGGEPQRGDIVVFKDPGGWLDASQSQPPNKVAAALTKIGLYPEGGHLVKRVIGVAGDTVECCDEEGRLLVNGVALNEDAYVMNDPNAPCRGPMRGCDWKTGPIPDGHVFVMGDNRYQSSDSSVRICRDDQTECVPGREFVSVDRVVGKVFVLLWPADRFRFLQRPDTFADVPDGS